MRASAVSDRHIADSYCSSVIVGDGDDSAGIAIFAEAEIVDAVLDVHPAAVNR
jgi:hypothetical protein